MVDWQTNILDSTADLQNKQPELEWLQDTISDANNDLAELKNSLGTLDDSAKLVKWLELKSTIENIRQELDTLKKDSSNNADKIKQLESQYKKLNAEFDRTIWNQLSSLEASIKKSNVSPDSKDVDDKEKAEKRKKRRWIFGSIGALSIWWILLATRKRRKERREARRAERAKNKATKETKDRKPFWDRWYGKVLKWVGIGTGIYYLAHGIYTGNWHLRDIFDRERGKKISFEDALAVAEWNIANQTDHESMSYDIDLKYLEDTSEIQAYWEKIKIDKKRRKIDWLNIKFKKYEHLIATAIVVAFLKQNYSGMCARPKPFNLGSSWRGNINVNTWDGSETAVDWTSISWKITGIGLAWILAIVSWIYWWLKLWMTVWIVGGIVSVVGGHLYDSDNILNKYMPELDNEYWKKALSAYLNRMDCWQQKNQTKDDITESPIKEEVIECMNEIQKTAEDKEYSKGERRKLDAIPDPNDKTKYTIKAYNRDFKAEVLWTEWNRTIKILWISWWYPSINVDPSIAGFSDMQLPLKEWIHMAIFIWSMLDQYPHKWTKSPRFKYRTPVWVLNYGVFFNDGTNWWYWTRVLKKDKFKQRMPTLFEQKDSLIRFLNEGVTCENNISFRKKT